MRPFHKPVHRPGDVIESWTGDGDPASLTSLAHETAAALLHRVREADDPAVVDKVIAYADEHGIDDVAELWAASPADTLPGAMWRIYLLRHVVRSDAQEVGYEFSRGVAIDTVNQAISGAASAPSPDQVVGLATRILRGAFEGDFAMALERAAAFSRALGTGARELAEDEAGAREERRRSRAEHYARTGEELAAAARLWRSGQLP